MGYVMKQLFKLFFVLVFAGIFSITSAENNISAKPITTDPSICTHPTLNIEDLGEFKEYTHNAAQYCYYMYHRFHAHCSECGYDSVYADASYQSVGHTWATILVEEGSDYLITRTYCTTCRCNTGNNITVKKIPDNLEVQ